MTLLNGAIEEVKAPAWRTFIGHYCLAVVVGMVSGLFGASVVAGIVGYFCNRRFGNRTALWIWILGFTWFFTGALELFNAWSPSWSQQSRVNYLAGELFGTVAECGSTECLYELFYTWPFLATVGYAIGARLGLSAYRERSAVAR
jgi:hypothetical protein